jgi:hypothetical protein
MHAALGAQGLCLTDLDDRDTSLAPAALRLRAAPPVALAPALDLLCMKNCAAAAAAAQLRAALRQ